MCVFFAVALCTSYSKSFLFVTESQKSKRHQSSCNKEEEKEDEENEEL